MSIDILNSNDKLIHVLFIVKTASGQSHSVTACGNVELPTVSGKRRMIDNVLLVPGIRRNLLSIGTLTDTGMIAWFDCNQCWPLADKTQPRIIARGQRDDSSGLYYLNFEHLDTQQKEVDLTAAKSNDTFMWHRRLKHLSFQALHHLSTSTAARGIPNLPLIKTPCEQCHMGKQFQKSTPKKSITRAAAPLELLHDELCRPISRPSIGKAQYFMNITDDFSRKTWLFFLKNKNEALPRFKEFVTVIEQQTWLKVKWLRSDRGVEYTSNDFNAFCKDKVILRQLTMAHTPEQNGVLERKNRTILNRARSMVHQVDTPARLWAEILSTASSLINASPTTSNYGIIPEQGFTVKHRICPNSVWNLVVMHTSSSPSQKEKINWLVVPRDVHW